MLSFIDRRIPPGLSATEQRRARFLVAVLGFAVIAALLAFVPSVLIQGASFEPRNALGVVGSLVLAGVGGAVLRTGRVHLAVSVVLVVGFVVVDGVALITGGIRSPAFFSNLVLMVIAGAAGTARQAAAVFLAAMGVGTLSLLFGDQLPPADITAIDWYLTGAFLFAMCNVLVVALSSLHEIAEREASVREAELLSARERLVTTTVSTNYMRSVLAATGDMLIVTDEDLIVVDVNPAAVEGIGQQREELIGRSLSSLGDLEAVLGPQDRRGQPGQLHRVDGRSLPVSVSRGRLGTGSTGYAGFVFALADVTVQQAAVEAVQRAHGQAEAANHAKSRFLANMSHELRTPLNAIIGYSELLSEEVEEPGPREDLGRVQDAAQHLLRLINGILDLSKVEAGRVQLVLDEVDVDPLLQGVVDAIRPSIREGVALEVDLQTVGVARLDDMKTRQILLNLLSNAAKFTHEGRVRLEARRWEREGMPWLRVEVQDSGPGIAPDRQAAIFEPFSQADATTERTYGGTGLGLSISQAFARMMGGEIHVESVLGEGSRFVLELPIGDFQQLRTPAAGPERAIPLREQDELVLCIDDDRNALELVSRLLSRNGRQVVGTTDAEQGLAWARTLRPDLITLDIQMPRMSGWNVLAHLRDDPVLRSIPVVVVTAEGEENVALALGARAQLHKPVERQALQELVARLLA